MAGRRRRRKARRNDPSPRRRRRSTRRRPTFFGLRANPRRRRRRSNPRRRRSYRRNPARGGALMSYAPRMQDVAMDVLWAGAGFMGTKFVGNMIMPAIGVTQPMARIAVKAGLATGTAWGLSFLLGQRQLFTPLLLGGMAEVIQDTVRTYISPFVPALAAAEYPMEAYPTLGQERYDYEYAIPGAVGAYPELGQEADVEVAP